MLTGQEIGIVLASGENPAPEPEDVTAGPWGLLVFVLLVVATAILLRSFVKQLRKTEQARRAGVFGPVAPDDDPQGRGGNGATGGDVADEETPRRDS